MGWLLIIESLSKLIALIINEFDKNFDKYLSSSSFFNSLKIASTPIAFGLVSIKLSSKKAISNLLLSSILTKIIWN